MILRGYSSDDDKSCMMNDISPTHPAVQMAHVSLSSSLGLAEKLVVVTGSTDGIGLEIARTFLEQNANVVLNGRSQQKLDKAIASLHNDPLFSSYGSIHGIAADLSDSKSCEDFVNIVRAIGEVDVLVNNLGIFEVKDFFELTDDDWLRYHNTNVMSTVRLSRAFMPHMLKRGHGRILIMASECGVRPIKEMIQYSVSKTTLIGLARALSELTQGTQVTVNSILAGPTFTPGVEEYVKGLAAAKNMSSAQEMIQDYFTNMEPTSLIQRFITPREVADVVVFLASAKAAAINGHAQRVEGGLIRHI